MAEVAASLHTPVATSMRQPRQCCLLRGDETDNTPRAAQGRLRLAPCAEAANARSDAVKQTYVPEHPLHSRGGRTRQAPHTIKIWLAALLFFFRILCVFPSLRFSFSLEPNPANRGLSRRQNYSAALSARSEPVEPTIVGVVPPPPSHLKDDVLSLIHI